MNACKHKQLTNIILVKLIPQINIISIMLWLNTSVILLSFTRAILYFLNFVTSACNIFRQAFDFQYI